MSASEFVILHRPVGKDPEEAPFKLKIEYRHAPKTRTNQDEYEQVCHTIDIRMIVEPLETAQDMLKCSDEELSASKQARRKGFSFSYSSTVEKELVLLHSQDTSLFLVDGKQSDHFATVSYDIDIQTGGNSLTLLATYPFS